MLGDLLRDICGIKDCKKSFMLKWNQIILASNRLSAAQKLSCPKFCLNCILFLQLQVDYTDNVIFEILHYSNYCFISLNFWLIFERYLREMTSQTKQNKQTKKTLKKYPVKWYHLFSTSVSQILQTTVSIAMKTLVLVCHGKRTEFWALCTCVCICVNISLS